MQNLFKKIFSKPLQKKETAASTKSSNEVSDEPRYITINLQQWFLLIQAKLKGYDRKKLAIFLLIILFGGLLLIKIARHLLMLFYTSRFSSPKALFLYVVLFIIFLSIGLFRPVWYVHFWDRLKSKILSLRQYTRRRYASFRIWFRDWRERFSQGSGREKWVMTRKPIFILLIIVLILKLWPLFIPPKILTSFPGNQSNEAPLDTHIEVIFTKGVIKSSAQRSFAITPHIEGAFTWESNQKLLFTPKVPLKRGASYQVSFKGLVLSQFLVPLFQKNTITFETVGNPQVVLASPRTEAGESLSPLTVVFDRPMIPFTTATNSAEKKPAFTVTPDIAGSGRWLGTTAYQFRPDVAFKQGTTYTVQVPGGLHAEDGGNLQKAYTWQFSSERPHIDAVSPISGADYASPVASIAAFFSQSIDQVSIAKSFHVYDKNGRKIDGSVQVSDAVAGFYPSVPLRRNEQYNAVIDKGARGSEGPNGMDASYSWSFTVASAPEVLTSTPSDGQKAITEQYRMDVNFRTPMDQDSFDGNVTIDPKPDTDPSLYFSSYNGQNSLTINTYLGRSQKYTVTIGPNAKDQYGVPLGKPYSFSFSTSPYQPSLSIYPFGTFFGAFNQQVTPRVVAQVINSNHIDYTLYKLQKNDVLDLYRRHYETVCGQRTDCGNWQDYNTSKLAKIKSWKQDFQADKNTPVQVVTKVTNANGSNLPSGFYLLDLKIPQGPHDNMVMIVSKSTVTVKKSDGQIFTWAVNQASGNTVSNMHMQLMDDSGTVLADGSTNSDGVFMKNVTLGQKQNLFVLGQSNDDVVLAASAWSQGIDVSDFGLPNYYSQNEQKDETTTTSFKTYLVLDRPIYRPGQKIYFKGVMRKDNDGAYENVPEGEKVAVSIMDGMNRKVYSANLPLSTYGSFAGDFTMGKDANVGTYQLGSFYKGNSATQAFQVEEYKKPDIAVTVTPSKTDYVQGETADITMNGSYYFGAPVTNTPISYTVETQDYAFQWSKDWRFEFGDPDAYWDHPWWYYSGSGFPEQTLVTQGKGVTDSKGNFVIHLPLDISKNKTSQKMVIEAVVNDINNQAIAASDEITVHKSALYAGLHPSTYANQSGSPSSVDIVTLDDKGVEVPNTPVSVTFYKRTWETIREQDPNNGNFYYTSKPSDAQTATTTATTDGFGHTTASFTPTDGGTYKAVVSVTDKSGNQNTSGTFVWVAGTGFEAPRENNDRIVLQTDRPDYFVGDTASVFIATPFASSSAKTLLTAERGSVLNYKIVDSSDTKNNFKMPIPSTYTPNAFIGAVLVKPGSKVTDPAEFKIGYTPISVTDKKHQITVSISTNSKRYKPRDVLHATITTKDGNGKPVPAEVAIGLVDKAVWDLAQVELPDIYKVFYEPRSLGVSTSQLLTMSIDRINANLNLGAKGGSGGGCFTGNTPILMSGGGYKNIADIKVGDKVLTRESETAPNLVSTKVQQKFTHVVDRYLIINGTLHVTPVHKMFVNNRWTVAGNIIVGDYLLDKNNHAVKVFSVEQVMGKFTVYNLETETYHTFFAGDIYVHNQKGGFDTSRSNFPDTAYWNPYVKTDSSGKADITIPLPDSLTTWRLAAIANTNQAAFGSTTDEVVVSRDVIIRPFLPRFLAVGDKPQLGAIIVNTSGSDQNITAKIAGTGIDIPNNQPQKQVLKDGEETKIIWPVVTQNTQSAKITLSVSGDNNAILDSVVTTLPVKSYSVPEVVATSGQAKDSAEEHILLPKDVDRTQGQLDLTYSPSLGSSSFDALNSIFNSEYSSIELVASKLLPALAVNTIFSKNNIKESGNIQQSTLQSTITNELQTLNSYQHSDGGWGWFIEEDSDPFLSAYVMHSLHVAKKDGFSVSDQTIKRGENYLSTLLSYNEKRVDKNVQAYILYVLSENNSGYASYGANLFERRFELSVESRAYLSMALKNIPSMSGQGKQLYDELIGLSKLTATTAHWEQGSQDYLLFGSNTTATAAMLEAMTMYDRRSPFVPETIRYLMSIESDGQWNTTRETAAVVQAIANQLLQSGDQNPNEHYQVSLNNKTLKEGTFMQEDLLKIITSVTPVKNLAIGTRNTLRIMKSGTGNLYYNMNLKYYLPFSTINSLEQGMVITRDFVNDKGQELPMDSINQDTEVWVRLTIVAPAERHFVEIEDVLPAGLESINESLKNVSVLNKQNPGLKNTSDNFPYFDHKEYHDDKTTIFASYLPAGVYEVSYRVRATTPGVYHYPPAQAFELYTPDVSGHSSGGWLEVK